jgi:hypothetical protein
MGRHIHHAEVRSISPAGRSRAPDALRGDSSCLSGLSSVRCPFGRACPERRTPYRGDPSFVRMTGWGRHVLDKVGWTHQSG